MFALSIFALVLVLGFANAAGITLTPVSVPTSADYAAGTVTGTYNVTYSDTGSTPISITFVGTSNFGNVTIPTTTMSPGDSQIVTATFSFTPNNVGDSMTGTITAQGGTFTSNSATYSISITSNNPTEIVQCAQTGNPADLTVKHIQFTNNGLQYATFGTSSTWYPFENLSADIQVTDNGNERVDNIDVYWGIWDTSTNQWIIQPNNLKEFNLNNGKTEDLTVNFKIDNKMDADLSELDDGNHYEFYVYASGQRDNDSVSTCASNFKDADIAIESDFVILNNIQVPTSVQCGQTVQVTADAWNIGSNDQDDVTVHAYGVQSALNFSQSIDLGSVDAFDRKPLSFSFTVPPNVPEQYYTLDMTLYDSNGDIFQNSNNNNAEFTVPIQVSGGCVPQVSLIASTVSGGQTGQPLQIKATITNTGTTTKTYTVSESGYSSWASSATADQSQVTVGAGQSANVVFTFDVNNNAAGTQTFTINLLSGSDSVQQPVSVTITQSSGFLGISGNTFSGNALIWGMGILILILVILIIIVAVKNSRK